MGFYRHGGDWKRSIIRTKRCKEQTGLKTEKLSLQKNSTVVDEGEETPGQYNCTERDERRGYSGKGGEIQDIKRKMGDVRT